LLSGIESLQLPEIDKDYQHIFQSYIVLLGQGIDRSAFMTNLKEKDIETVVGNHSLHSQPFYKNKYGCKDSDVPNSFAAAERSVALPLYPQMTEVEINLHAETVKNAL